jgi:hypothetical protein
MTSDQAGERREATRTPKFRPGDGLFAVPIRHLWENGS